MQINEQEYMVLTGIIQSRSGLYFDKTKEYYVCSRVVQRMKVLHCVSVNEYLKIVKKDNLFHELDMLIESLTTNETYFYREINQLTTCIQDIVPLVMKKKRSELSNTLRFWSAGCSIGCEPYTIALLLKETVSGLEQWDVQIIGTDISNKALEYARQGIYSEQLVKDVPCPIKKKYFTEVSHKKWAISQDIKRMVEFKTVNLINEEHVSSMRGFDFVFCRNVIIYFDKDTSKYVLNLIYDSIADGGYIFLGHSESISRFSDSFKLQRINDSLVYHKAK